MGKIKIENFEVFDIHWLCRTSRYAIVKVDVTERHGIFTTIWRTSAVEVTALSKIETNDRLKCSGMRGKNERYARKIIFHGCEGQIEKKSVPRDHSPTRNVRQ